MLVVIVVPYVCLDHLNRKSTQIYANRSPIHPRLALLKSQGAGGLLGEEFFTYKGEMYLEW